MVVKEGPIMIKEMGLEKAVWDINIGVVIGEEAPITQKLNDQNLSKKSCLWIPSSPTPSRIAMSMIPSKVAVHTRYLLDNFNDSDVDSIAQEICQVASPMLFKCLSALFYLLIIII